ncbi:MAG: T9SS type A sorting domain-containing protein [Sphingobacteriales bacterium]|nr:MAG: T9SS type A sorting domain-containing protein [Sphingobacteriales bacterium]
MNSDFCTSPRWLHNIVSSGRLVMTLLICFLVLEAHAQPAVTITNGPTTCGGTNGLIRVSNLIINQPYIVYYVKNGTALPGAFILSTDGSGNLDIVTWGTFTMTAGTYTDIQVSDGVTTSTFPGPYTLTDPAPPNPSPTSNSPVCEGGTLNLSTTMLGATYLWSGPGGFSSNSMAPSLSPVTTAHAGTYTLRVVANSTLCTTYVNVPVVVNAKPVIGTISGQTMCAGTNSTYVNIPVDLPGTTFSWANSNASIGLAASGTGNIPSFTSTNTTNAPITGTVTITPTNNSCVGSTKNVAFTVNPIPVLDPISNKNLCHNNVSPGIPVTSAVSAFASWTNSQPSIGLAASGVGNVSSFTATNTGTAPVTAVITYSALANGCTGPNMTFNITVAPTPAVSTITNQVYCNGSTAPILNIPATISGTTFTWTNSQPSIGLAASGTGNIPAFTTMNNTAAPVTATIAITPSANGCTGPVQTYTITVNPTPGTNAIANQVHCNGATAPLTAISGTVSGTSYAWTNNTTTIGVAASGSGNIPAFTATNGGIAPVVATISVVPSANGCTGATSSFTVTVNPTTIIGTIDNQAVCHGSNTESVNIPATVSGTTFAWTNSNTATGLAASGTGNIASFTGTNTTNAPRVSTVSVTPTANGCTGPVSTFTITVNLIPTVNTVSDQTRCNGSATAAITYTGNVSGTSYNWVNNNTMIGLSASGTGSIGSFNGTNTTNATITSTIAVTPVANNCTGTTSYFTITVNPTPTVIAIPSQTVCNGAPTAAVNIGAPVSGTTFAWTNNNTSIGLAASGTGNLPSFTATNIQSTTEVAQVTVIPTANSCVGTASIAEYVVHPTPVIDAVSGDAACNGATVPAVTLSSAVSGATFAWTNNKTSIGLGAGGTNANIPSFTASNTTTAPVIATISAVATANNCVGNPMTYTITVNPTPTVNTLTDLVVCNMAKTPAIGFSSPVSGATYAWVNDLPAIGLAASGTGAIDTFTAINNTPLPVVATVTVTPTANGCVGIDSSYTITVNPTPLLSSVLNPAALCNKITFSYTPTSATPGTTFAWTRAAVAGIANSSRSGTNNPNESLDNTTPNPLTVKYVYTLSANACNNEQIVLVVVNPTPKLTSPLTAVICGGSNFTYTPATLTAGTTFAWSRSAITGVTPTTGSGTGNINETLTNATRQPVTVTYNYVLTANGCSNTEQLKLRLDYLPDAPMISTMPPTTLCAGTMYQNFGVDKAPGTDRRYYWTADNAVVWAQGEDRQYAVVNFPAQTTALVKVTVVIPSTTCKVESKYEVSVKADKAPQPELTYFNDRFIALFDAASYQWGYDDKRSLEPTLYPHETGQDHYDANPDFDNRYYWVATVSNGCTQKTYYNKPLDVATTEVKEHNLKLYPNPATDKVTVELKLSNGGNYKIALHDMAGRIIKTTDATGDRTSIDVAELPAGFYMISCYANGVKMVSSRFAKH